MNYLVASSQGQLKMAEDLSDAASPTEQSFRRPMGRKLILYWGMGFFSSCACLCVGLSCLDSLAFSPPHSSFEVFVRDLCLKERKRLLVG